MMKKEKYQENSKVVYIARTILGSGLLCVMLSVLNYDMREAAIQFLQNIFFLLSAHICYIFAEKRRNVVQFGVLLMTFSKKKRRMGPTICFILRR